MDILATRTRTAGLLSALALLAAAAVPAGAAAHTKIVNLDAKQRYRGYVVTIRAMKQDYEPLRISVILRNGVQTHRYEFDAPRNHLTFRRNLRAGSLRLASLSGAAQSASRGDGTIRFAATGSADVKSCSGGRSTTTRPVARTTGRLRFSPTSQHEFVRRGWTGSVKKLAFGGCARPVTCESAARVNAFRTDGNETFSVLAWRYRSGGPVKVEGTYFAIDPVGPSVFTLHTRTAKVARSRFSATDLSHGSLDLEGVPGFSGSFEVHGEGDPQPMYPPCRARFKEGTAEGVVETAFAFAPDRRSSAWTGGMIARGRL